MKRFAHAASSFVLIVMLAFLAVPAASAAALPGGIPFPTITFTPPPCECHTPTVAPTQPPTQPPTVPPTVPPTQPPTEPPTNTPTTAPTVPVTPTATSTTTATATATTTATATATTTATATAKTTKTPPSATPAAGTVVALPVTGAGAASGNGSTIWLLIGAAMVLLAGAWSAVRRQRR